MKLRNPKLICLVLLLMWAAAVPSAAVEPSKALVWHEVGESQIEGKGWNDTKSLFDRLPARAEGVVRDPVWELSHDSAGMYVQFQTDASTISVRWTLNSNGLAMPHMPATGVSGVDLYIRDGGKWHFLANGRPTMYPTNEVKIVEGLAAQQHEFRLYLPLYNGVSKVEIGVPSGTSFQFVEAAGVKGKAIVVYGTSITQGGCASRPGMSYPAILGRRLGVPVINLGFSGNGKAEPEVARFLAELEPVAFVLDPLPNLFAKQVGERLPEFVAILREKRPEVPIVLVESPIYPDAAFIATRAERVKESNEILRKLQADRAAAGDRQISIIPARDLFGEDGEAAVDSVHPTDLGFLRMADAMEPYIRKAIE